MIKQEEIREVVWEFLDDYEKDKPAVDWAFILLHRLAAKGVVIKGEGISDDLAQTTSEPERYCAVGNGIALISFEKTFSVFKAFKEMGYTATSPLIKED